jgi:hypothetical protein
MGFFYAHRGIPPDSSSEDDGCEEDGAAEGVWDVSASNHTDASGVRILPVGTHTQVNRPFFRIVTSLLFIVPPFRSVQTRSNPAPGAWIGRRHEPPVVEW